MNLQLFSSGTILARKWKFFAQKEDSTPKSFIQISGVTKFTIWILLILIMMDMILI